MAVSQPAGDPHRLPPKILAADHAPEAGCVIHPSNTLATYWHHRWQDAATEAATAAWRVRLLADQSRDLALGALVTMGAAFAAGILVGLAVSHVFSLWG